MLNNLITNINKSTLWHVFYCSMIAILVYLNASYICNENQFTDSIESNQLMAFMSKKLTEENPKALQELQDTIESSGDTISKPQIDTSIEFVKQKKEVYDYIASIRAQLWQHCGGSFSSAEPNKMLRYKYYFPYKNFFDDAKIKEIKGKMNQLEGNRNKLLGKLSEEEYSRIAYYPVWSDLSFWARLQHCSPTHALQKLDELMYSTQLDERRVLNYHFFRKVEYYEHCYSCAYPQLRIISEQINIINQEDYEGYLKYINSAFLCKKRDFTCLVNGKKVAYKDGAAYMKYKPQKHGKNTIHVEIQIKNPVTGKTDTLHAKRFFYAK